jgi:hypothetical protein
MLLLGSVLSAQKPIVASAALQSSTFCYDAARNRLVFPQSTGTILEWDGQNWGQSSAVIEVPLTVATYEPVSKRVFGRSGNRLVAYDGHSFVDRGPWPAGTTTGQLHADQQGGLLLLRGSGIGGVLFDRWDGTEWQPLPTPGTDLLAPIADAYDIARNLLVAQVLHLDASMPYETWEWDGVVWTLRLTDNARRSGLGYDSANQRVLSVNNGTFAWNGATWTQVPTEHGPIHPTSLADDPSQGRLWAWRPGQGERHEVWFFDGSDWSSIAAPHPVVGLRPMIYDAARDRTILFGFEAELGQNVHSEWDGTAWSDLPTGSGPSTRMSHSVVYDPIRQETVVFGGAFGAALHGDTWTWNGTGWTLVATSGPSPRNGAATTFDSSRGRLVLVGGNSKNGLVSDHWEWDGASWTQVAAMTPIGQVPGMLGYDEARQRLVLVDQIGRTWEHDGVQWMQVGADGPHAKNDEGQLVWNAAAQRVQGNLYNSNAALQRHEWDGTSWTAVSPYRGVIAFDQRRSLLLACNANALTTFSTQPATAMHSGMPCGGTTTATSLSAFGAPRPGNHGLHLDLRAEATQRPAMLGFAFQSTSIDMGNGCTMYLQNPFAMAIWFTDASGYWHHPLALPGNPSLRGFQFVVQGAVLDPDSAGGFAMTQGLQLTVGD